MSGIRQNILESVRKILPRRVKGWLYKLSVSEHVEGSIYYHVNMLKNLGYKPDTVLDIGAFRGEWTKNVLPIFSSARFVMFEPQDDKEPLLKSLINEYPRISYLKSLVGKSSGEVEFFEMESGSSIYEEQTNHPRRKKTYSMKTLDELMAGQALGEVFIKMDVQGAELDVLEGATETLKHCGFLLLEASVLNYNSGAPLFAEYVDFMARKGFVLFDVCDIRRKSDGVLFQIDLIFSRIDSTIRNQVNFKKS